MSDEIERSNLPYPPSEYVSDPVYRVKHVNADADRKSHDQFEEQLKRRKKQQQEKDDPHLDIQDEGKDFVDIQDDVVLSLKARKLLRKEEHDSAPLVDAAVDKEIKPPPNDVHDENGPHINLKA